VTALESALVSRGLAINNPWYFPSPEEYWQLLESQGFAVQTIDLFPRPTILPGDLSDWITTCAQPFISVVPVPERHNFMGEVVASLSESLCDASGRWTADYVRLRVSARKTRIETE